MDYKEFESKEQRRFFNQVYSFKEVRCLLTNITKHDYPYVIVLTKKGLQNGIEKYVGKTDVPSIYLTDLLEWYFDRTIAEEISIVLKRTHKNLLNIESYSLDVNEAYAKFIYQDSVDRFREEFNLPKRIFI